MGMYKTELGLHKSADHYRAYGVGGGGDVLWVEVTI